MKKLGRPRSEIRKYKTSITIPIDFHSDLQMCTAIYPECKDFSYSEKIAYILKQVAMQHFRGIKCKVNDSDGVFTK